MRDKLKSHVKMINEMRGRFKGITGFVGWILTSVVLSAVMFFPAAMHFTFEFFLFACGSKMRKRFKCNLVKMHEQMKNKNS